jgi:hypothetical protein
MSRASPPGRAGSSFARATFAIVPGKRNDRGNQPFRRPWRERPVFQCHGDRAHRADAAGHAAIGIRGAINGSARLTPLGNPNTASLIGGQALDVGIRSIVPLGWNDQRIDPSGQLAENRSGRRSTRREPIRAAVNSPRTDPGGGQLAENRSWRRSTRREPIRAADRSWRWSTVTAGRLSRERLSQGPTMPTVDPGERWIRRRTSRR